MPQQEKKGSGFSPCNGDSEPQRVRGKCGAARAHILCNNEDEHGASALPSGRNAALLIDVLRSLVRERVFKLHDFVIMPDHMHLLLSVKDSMTIEKAMQMVKGRFSYRLKKELGIAGEVWQRGFSEVQVLDAASFEAHRTYIAENPVKARLVSAAGQYAFCYEASARKKSEARVAVAQGLKP